MREHVLDVEPVYGEPVCLEGRYEVDPIPGGKRLQGSWLVLDDGTRYVISYRPVPEYLCFVDKRVCVRGTPYTPGSDTQHVMVTHLAVDSIELAPGETPCEIPPPEVPLPPLVDNVEALAAREGRWARVTGTLETVRDDPDGYLGIAELELADGTRIVARNVPRDEWDSHLGRTVTVTSRVERSGEGHDLIGWYAIAAGEGAE
jgi:hypothetical protein